MVNNLAMIDLSGIAFSLPVRFYSNTLPEEVAWPFVLVHLNDYEVRLRQYETFVRHVVLDINVHRFRHIGDYPMNELVRYGRVVRSLAEKYRDRICFIMPDLPWDPEGYFRGSQYSDNIRKTYTYHVAFLRYVAEACHRFGSQLMFVLQHRPIKDEPRVGKRKVVVDVEGRLYYLRRSCAYVEDLLSVLKWDHVVYGIAVGGLCVVDSPKIIAKFLDVAFRWFPQYRIHGLGLTLSVVRYVPDVCRYSYDSTGWTKPVCSRVYELVKIAEPWIEGKFRQKELATGRRIRRSFSCKTSTERTIFFLCYVARLCENLGLRGLAREVWELAERYAYSKRR